MPKPQLIPLSDVIVSAHTVIFVHGLIGDPKKTWGRFPELLRKDRQLPVLNIRSFGYKTKLFGFWCPGLETVCRHLATAVSPLPVRDDESIFLIGHSMGGLVILGCLVEEMEAERAQEAPVRHVSRIWLFATPVDRKAFSYVVQAAIKGLRRVRWLWSSQLMALAEGDFIENLMSRVHERLYSPAIAPGEETSKRKITVEAHVGEEDPFSRIESMQFHFPNPPPREHPRSHKSLKKPENEQDPIYEYVKADIAKDLQEEFYVLCRRCAAGEEDAIASFSLYYSPKLRDEVSRMNPGATAEELRECLAQLEQEVWRRGAAQRRVFGYALGLALAQLSKQWPG